MTISQIKADPRVMEFNRVYDEDFRYEMVLIDGYVFDDGLESSYSVYDSVKEASYDLLHNVKKLK